MQTLSLQDHFVLQSTVFVDPKPHKLITILGSCVSVCMYDTVLKIGGMNHYMMPWWDGKSMASPKFGDIAIEQLIERMMRHGSRKEHMTAKIFGGSQQHFIGQSGFNVGEKNVATAEKMLRQYKINITGRHTGGTRGRRIAFNTQTNQVFMKMIEPQKLRKAI